MTTAQFEVLHAGPLVTIQDSGRPGHLRYGVTGAGPMDRCAHTTANLALGNSQDNTCIEVSMAGLELSCTAGALSFAVVGAGFSVICNGSGGSNRVATIEAGQTLSIRPGRLGSWCYLAFAGTLNVPSWLGHTATHALTGMGGGLVTTGQKYRVNAARICADREGPVKVFECARFTGLYRVVIGPQEQHFSAATLESLLNDEFTLSSAYDRMGVRLDGPALTPHGSLSIPSEPLLKGSIQVSGDGVPTVLLVDHQTTGGYPKIATLASVDLDNFVQLRAADQVRFKAVSAQEALRLARERGRRLSSYFEEICTPNGSLEDRLNNTNLISGVVGDMDEN